MLTSSLHKAVNTHINTGICTHTNTPSEREGEGGRGERRREGGRRRERGRERERISKHRIYNILKFSPSN